ncbi:methyltransferase family protein [Massarina eburnea CBS 473.64]|uniref:Methyltransferase family protein n=1 Tax=Massarina eburnea CBS 473.64 TaxID=1395130 RepID=A0A6A6RUN2_9PLEO|nr:methyltransferase family protein [Massarina eburnea CBS 473.64]
MAAVEASTSTPEVFGGTEGQYLLPHHVSEIDRLRRQHQYTKSCCDGNLLGFPLPESKEPLKILDSGCADGTWLLDLASEYPQKQLSLNGIDIGSNLFLANPQLDLRQHDLLQQFPEGWGWKDNFDIIHQRFLVWGLKEPEWLRVVRNLGTVLKPGGRIQLVECKWIFPELWETHPEQHKLALTQIWSTKVAGMDIYIGEKLVDILQDLGYEDVTTVPYPFAYGASAKREEDRDSSAHLWVESFRHLAGRMGGGIPGVAKTPEEYHAFLDRLVEEIKTIGYAPELRMVSGRKPL